MRKIAAVLVIAAFLVLAINAKSDQPAQLARGTYEVSIRLELPHVEDQGAFKIANICIAAPASGGNHGLAVLSENNPLAHCPASNVREEGDTLTFDIICPGGNAAIASAKYTLGAQRFEGRIDMKMGGKNMTMTETQAGRRTGDCSPNAAPRS
jgi:Protein of unknown function (DUF3617)